MAYDSFTENSPVASDLGASGGFAEIIEKNLQDLRNAVNTGLILDWDFTANVGGSDYVTPDEYEWSRIFDGLEYKLRCQNTWTGDYVTATVWEFSYDGGATWELIGNETIVYDVDENLETVTWSGTAVFEVIEDAKPLKTDLFMETVDYIRNNIMALRAELTGQIMYDWDYSVSGGTAEEPQYLIYTKGSEKLRATNTYSTGLIQTVVWEYDSGSGYIDIGTETYAFDSDGETETITWSAAGAYESFQNNKPSSADNADTTIANIKRNFLALRDGCVIGSMYWNYSKTDGTGSNDKPQYYYYKNGSLWIQVENVWGTDPENLDSIIQQTIIYTETGGAPYETAGTVNYVYDSPTILKSSTWV